MTDARDLFRGVRPSDVRFENFHMLAEWIEIAQRLVDTSAVGREEAKKLLAAALGTSKEGVARFDAAGRRLEATADVACAHFEQVVAEQRAALMEGLTGAMKTLADSAERLTDKTHLAMREPVDQITQVAERLELAAAEAESRRAAASDARMKLIDYRRNLDAHEAAVTRRLAEAKARAYAGLSFWARLWAVLSPPAITARLPPAPVRPGAK